MARQIFSAVDEQWNLSLRKFLFMENLEVGRIVVAGVPILHAHGLVGLSREWAKNVACPRED